MNVSCHGDLADRVPVSGTDLPTAPSSALTYDNKNTEGVVCCSNFDGTALSTTNWHETITPSGNVTLTCHFKKTDAPTLCGCAFYEYYSDEWKTCWHYNPTDWDCQGT